MDRFVQVLAGVLLAVILGIALNKQGKDMSLVLTVAVCCLVLTVVLSFLEPVVDFVEQLRVLGRLDSDMVRIMIKAVGISIVGEISALICADAGNAAMGKAVQMLTAAAVLWLALPLMQGLLDLVQRMLGEV